MSKLAKEEKKFRLNVTGTAGQELELVQVDEDTQDAEGLNVDSLAEEHAEPNLVETTDGRMIIEMKPGKTCDICSVTFQSAKIFKKHKEECLEKISEFADVLEKEKTAAMSAQPGEEFFKYCNPNPENPCYCCGEDVSTAHVGHMKCKLCPKSFKAYEYLERHLQAVHADTTEFGCTQCNAKCPSVKVLGQHMMTHSAGKPFSCLKCGKDFTRKYHLERHLNHSSCGEIPKYLLPCEVCGKEFTRLDNLREHLRYHMGEAKRKRDYQCPHCEKAFYGSSLLNIHIRTHTGEKPFPCDLCTKTFPSTGALRKHRRSHTGERPYRCAECSATFAARETLNRHRKTHTGERPHECTICGKKFIQATQLRAHMFNHTGENGFNCDQCEAVFNRKARLDEHIRFVHQKEAPLTCEVCSKSFIRKEDLNRHLDTHSDEKNFSCNHCGKLFASKAALKIHERTHIIEEPSVCSICNHSFIRRDCLVRHIRTRHAGCPEAMSKIPPRKIQSSEPPREEVLLEITETEATMEQMVSIPEEDEQMLEIDGEVYQITPLEDIQLVKINTRRKDIKNESQTVDSEMLVDEIEVLPTKLEPLLPVETKKAIKTKRSMSVKPPEMLPPPPPLAVEPAEINVPVEVAPIEQPPKEKKKRKRATENASIVLPTKIKIEEDDSMPIFLSDAVLKEKVNELLCMLIDEEVLTEFGWPRAPVDRVLSEVIKRCGHKPASGVETGDYTTRMRENTKILFALTMEDDSIRTLLNNHTIDEVIMSVLKSK
ncbi:AAEL002145-PA [Aedes aegypti]|uniref:C2H2-type domain-containing protein n=2 Tax=Aedes aegypti TaxID=7159 RepID=Q17J14_AEDAE|nr:oocyte zinc finger protein XlCOF6 [Aedes aegypti]XP_021693081.1 oocyte zinc finger protein XlCOF6 [Aedes aegypti]EAT46697.1 AAEL002145-PA [Aedes aegypti]